MELRTYIAPLRKWWWLILLSMAIAAGASYYAVSQQPPIYQARATLIIGNALNNPNPSTNDLWLTQQLASTYTDIAQRQVIRDAVQEATGLSALPSYAVRAIPDTQLIEIAVTDSIPERATVVANELANQLILRAPGNANDGDQAGETARQAFISQQLNDLEARITETSELILVKQDELAALVSARQIVDTENQIAVLENKLNTLQGNYASLLASTSAGATNSLRIIEAASVPQFPIGPEVLITVLTAAAIGLSLAVGAAYLLEYLDDTVKVPEDIQAVVDLPTLSGIAEYKSHTGKQYDLVTLRQPRSPISEAYRSLRTSVLHTNVDKQFKTLEITSANPNEGKSITAANLAVVMAQSGQRVLLIDADLRRPVQNRIFGTTHRYGLTELLFDLPASSDPAKLVEQFTYITKAVSATAQKDLYVIPSGAIPPNPAELIGSAKMKQLMGIVRSRFDYVIVDAPPALAVTDAVVLSTRVDSVLLVATAGSTRAQQLKQAVTRLEEVNAPVIGVVLNRLTARTGDYYYRAYYRQGYYEDGKASSDATEAKEPDASESEKTPSPSFLARFLS